MPDIENTTDIAALTVQLLSAYLANNTVASEDLSGLIRSTKAALTDETVAEPLVKEAQTYVPAVSIRKSLASSEHLLSLIDGKPYKTLKRHLTSHGLTPEAYRERYNLPSSYPMVAPDFAAKRRAIAEEIGLGRRRQEVAGDGVPVLEDGKGPSNGSEVAPSVAITDTASERAQSVAAMATKAKRRGARSSSPNETTPAKSRDKEHDAITAPSEAVVAVDKTGTPKVRRGKGKAVATPVGELSASAVPVIEQAAVAPVLKGARDKKPRGSASAPASKAKRRSVDSSTEEPVAVKPVSAVAEEVSARPAPKRRGKLGLFGKNGAANKETTPEVVSKDSAPESKGNAEVDGNPRGAGKPKRMARTPKETPSDAI